jgi:hypothetical protein
VIVGFLHYSQKRFILYDDVFISTNDPNSPFIRENSSLSDKKLKIKPLHFILGDPITHDKIRGLQLIEYVCSKEDTATVFNYKDKLSIAVLGVSIFNNIDLSKNEINKGIVADSPHFVVESEISIDDKNKTTIKYHIPKTNYNRLIIKIPYSEKINNSYNSSDSCSYVLSTNKFIIKVLGKREGNIIFVNEQNRTNVYLSLQKNLKGKMKMVIACPLPGYQLDLHELEEIIAEINKNSKK